MLKITVAVLALVLAGAVSAEGWRDLRFDASSEEAFTKSLETFNGKLTRAREYVLGKALQDIWVEGSKAANAEQREYTDAEYFARVDGLSYEEIVTLTDPTGDTAKLRYREASMGPRQASASNAFSGQNNHPPPVQNGEYRGYTTNGGIRLETNAGMK